MVSMYSFIIGNQVLVDTLLQDGSEVFRAGGGSSILIGGHSPSDTNSLMVIPRNSEGMKVTTIWQENFIWDLILRFYG